jgi:hypothetical protein
MFLGHYGLGMAAKKIAPKTSLGLLLAAAQWLDILWPLFLLLGIEQVRITPNWTKLSPLEFNDYPMSHSLLMVGFWALLWWLVCTGLKVNWKNSLILAALVVSHWVLDLVVHKPDLPLTPRGLTVMGFGLWNYPIWTINLEFILLIVGFAFYMGCTTAKDKIGSIGPWVLTGSLVAIYVATLVLPPPPSPEAIAWGGIALWVVYPLAYWIDQHRKAL